MEKWGRKEQTGTLKLFAGIFSMDSEREVLKRRRAYLSFDFQPTVLPEQRHCTNGGNSVKTPWRSRDLHALGDDLGEDEGFLAGDTPRDQGNPLRPKQGRQPRQ